MLDRIERVMERLDVVLKWLMTIIFGGMTILIFAQVVFRYVLRQSLSWSEELSRYMFIWITFVGGMVAARKNQHIGMEMAQDLLPVPLRRHIKALAAFLSAMFFGVIFYYCLQVWPKMMMQNTPALNLPMGYPYLGIIIGCFMMCLCYFLKGVTLVAGKRKGGEE